MCCVLAIAPLPSNPHHELLIRYPNTIRKYFERKLPLVVAFLDPADPKAAQEVSRPYGGTGGGD